MQILASVLVESGVEKMQVYIVSRFLSIRTWPGFFTCYILTKFAYWMNVYKIRLVCKFKVMREDHKKLKKKIFLLNMLLSKRQISEEYFFFFKFIFSKKRTKFFLNFDLFKSFLKIRQFAFEISRPLRICDFLIILN